MIALAILAAALAVWTPARGTQLILPDFRTGDLPNGMKLYIAEDHAAPTVSIVLAIPSGAEYETRSVRQLANLTAVLCLQGIPGMEGTAVWMKLQSLGGRIGGWADFDGSYFSMASLATTWTEVLDLLAASVQSPTFEAREFERIRRQWAVGEAENRENADQVASEHVMALLYEGPLGEPVTPEGIRAISREDMVTFHRTHYQPNHAVLVAIGDFDADSAEVSLRRAFEGWPPGEDPPPPPASRLRAGDARVRLVNKPGMTQAQIRCGGGAPRLLDPERYACRLACNVLGNGFSSRLVRKLRSEGGMTYHAASWHQDQLNHGQVIASVSTRNAMVGAAIDTMRSVLREIVRSGVSAEELQTAKSIQVGRTLIGNETPEQKAIMVGSLLSRGFSLEECRAIPARYESPTVEDANRVAGQCLDPEQMAWVIVGDERRIGADVARLGRVEVVHYRAPIHPGGFMERTRPGIGLTWNTAARGARVSLLHRWVLVSAAYGFAREGDPWRYDAAGQLAIDLHLRDSEYSSLSPYAGVTGTIAEGIRGMSPHLGGRVFPNGLGGRFSVALEFGRSLWDGPGGLPGFYLSSGIDVFF